MQSLTKSTFQFSGKAAEKGTWIVVGPEQQCMILGRNADKIKKALVETAKNLIKKRGVYWLSVEATHPAGRSAGLAGSTAQPVAAIRPARNAVPASAFEGEDGSDGFVDRGSCWERCACFFSSSPEPPKLPAEHPSEDLKSPDQQGQRRSQIRSAVGNLADTCSLICPPEAGVSIALQVN